MVLGPMYTAGAIRTAIQPPQGETEEETQSPWSWIETPLTYVDDAVRTIAGFYLDVANFYASDENRTPGDLIMDNRRMVAMFDTALDFVGLDSHTIVPALQKTADFLDTEQGRTAVFHTVAAAIAIRKLGLHSLPPGLLAGAGVAAYAMRKGLSNLWKEAIDQFERWKDGADQDVAPADTEDLDEAIAAWTHWLTSGD